jgi:hypothetical protein
MVESKRGTDASGVGASDVAEEAPQGLREQVPDALYVRLEA